MNKNIIKTHVIETKKKQQKVHTLSLSLLSLNLILTHCLTCSNKLMAEISTSQHASRFYKNSLLSPTAYSKHYIFSYLYSLTLSEQILIPANIILHFSHNYTYTSSYSKPNYLIKISGKKNQRKEMTTKDLFITRLRKGFLLNLCQKVK